MDGDSMLSREHNSEPGPGGPATGALALMQGELGALRAMAGRHEPFSVAQRRSPGWRALVGPLARAQAAYLPLVRECRATENTFDPDARTNSVRTWLYADLAALLDAVRPVLNQNGFVFTQSPVETASGYVMVTELLHESGEWLAAALPLPDLRALPVADMAAAITLARRYCAAPLLGIAAEEAEREGIAPERYLGNVAARTAPPPARERADGAPGASDKQPAPAPSPEGEAPAATEGEVVMPDYSSITERRKAHRRLREQIADIAKASEPDLQQAATAWLAMAPLLTKCPPTELSFPVELYRDKLKAEPPPIDGVEYPAAPPPITG